MPTAFQLLALSLRLLPIDATTDDGARALALRVEIAEACVSATDDRIERLLCMAIPRWESSYRTDVTRCAVRGAAGELGAWQVLPRSAAEAASLCVSVAGDARIAVGRLRESLKACRSLPWPDRLAVYTRGSCGSEEGRKLSRHRWPSDGLIRFAESFPAE